MSDCDRELIDLVATVAQVEGLEIVVDDCGADRVRRVLLDGFAVVAKTAEDLYFEIVLPLEEAFQVLRAGTGGYVIGPRPGAISLEDEPDLVFRYAADEPEAIAEVRSRNGVK